MISCIDPHQHEILLYDLRVRYNANNTLTMTWPKGSSNKSLSQYIEPRWSPAGMHVSCGSTFGQVHIWDIRVRGKSYPQLLPHQSLDVHSKFVVIF